jgi:uncharacterized protein (TIGR03118 family)
MMYSTRSRHFFGSATYLALIQLSACVSDNQSDVAVTPLVTLTNLVENVQSPGVSADTNLADPWGMAIGSTGAIWVSDHANGLATAYDGTGATIPLDVAIPTPSTDTALATPTGQAFNSVSTDFSGDMFIFVAEDGTIAGWQSGSAASLRADNSASGAVYKGIDIFDTGSGRVISAANFSNGTIDVFDASYHALTLSGGFIDPDPILGFAPFNILVDGDSVYVAYAKQDALMHDDVAGAGNGAIDVFDTSGNFVRRLITAGVLDSPWGLAIVPADYPGIGGDLLVGNFGDGRISAIDTMSGAVQGQLEDEQGNPISIPGLWTLRFGEDQASESHLQIFFTAGAGGVSGVLGRLDIAESIPTSPSGGGGGGYGGGYGY